MPALLHIALCFPFFWMNDKQPKLYIKLPMGWTRTNKTLNNIIRLNIKYYHIHPAIPEHIITMPRWPFPSVVNNFQLRKCLLAYSSLGDHFYHHWSLRSDCRGRILLLTMARTLHNAEFAVVVRSCSLQPPVRLLRLPEQLYIRHPIARRQKWQRLLRCSRQEPRRKWGLRSWKGK